MTVKVDQVTPDTYRAAGRILRRMGAVASEQLRLSAAYEAEMGGLNGEYADLERQAKGIHDTYGEIVHPYGQFTTRESVNTTKPGDKVLLEWAATHRPEAIKASVSVSGLEKCGAKFQKDGTLSCPDENGENIQVPGVLRETTHVYVTYVKTPNRPDKYVDDTE